MAEQPSHEETLIQRAVAQGMLTPAQVDECRGIRQELAGSGMREPLSEIIVRKGFLSRLQIQSLKKDAGLPLGQFGEYEILTRLGSGGMGTVYKARRRSTGQVVALKTLNARLIGNQSYLDRFMRETRSVARLSHPNIVRILDVGNVGETHYYAMEHVEGDPLSQILQTGGRMAEPRAIAVAIAVAAALQAIHRVNMVHRDIKPANILLAKNGEIKICDFGLAKTAGADASLTQVGTKLGTPFYMSPEQLEDVRTLDARSDLYSLGATLYHMVTGYHPYEGRSARSVISKHLSFDSSAPLSMEGVNPPMRAVLEKLMEKDPDRRYPSADAVIADLQRLAAGAPPIHARSRPAIPTVRPSRSYAPARSGSWAPVVVVVALIAVVGGAVVLFSGGGRKKEPPPPPKTETPVAAPTPKPPTDKPVEPPKPVVVNPPPQPPPKVEPPKTDPAEAERARKMEEEVSAEAKRADGLAAEKQFAKALEVYRALTAKYPELAAEPAMAAKIAPIARESGAADLMAAATADYAAKKWSEAAEKLSSMKNRYAGTAAETVGRAEIDRMLQSATDERSAVALIEKALERRQSSAWDDALALLREVGEKYGATETAKARDLAAMVAEVDTIRRTELDTRARALWDEAEKAREELRYKDAADLFTRFAEQFAGADFAKGRDAAKEIRELEKHREKAAEKAYAEAKRLQRSDPGKAIEQMFGVLEKFADAKWLTDRKRGEIDGAIDKLLGAALTGSVRLNGSVKGSIQLGGGSPFGFSGSSDVPASVLAPAIGGELAGPSLTGALQPLFHGAQITSATLRGTREGRKVTLVGTLALKGSAGSVGDVQVSATLTGAMELTGNTVGTFTWKSDTATVKAFIGHPGTASITISSK